MLYAHYEILLLFLLYAALEDLVYRKISHSYFLLSFLFFFLFIHSLNGERAFSPSLLFPVLFFLSLALSYPLFYFTAAGGADWKLCSLLLPLIPLGESLPLLLLASFFSFTGGGGGDWKLFSLLLSLLPLEKSIFLLFLSTPFSLLLFFLLKEEIPFAFSLFLAAVPVLTLFG